MNQLDDIEFNQQMNEINRLLDLRIKQNQELRRNNQSQNLQSQKSYSDTESIVRFPFKGVNGNLSIRKSSIRRESNGNIYFETSTMYDKEVSTNFSGKDIFFDYLIETQVINCKNNTELPLSGKFYLIDTNSIHKKGLVYSSKSSIESPRKIQTGSIDSYLYKYLCN